MELNGTYQFDAPREAVWDAIMDAEILANILPGCEHLERVSETEYQGTLNVRVGPVMGKFTGTVLLSDLNQPESFHMDIDGKGSAGFVKGGGDAKLEEEDGQTVLTYSGDAQVGGRIASVGQRLLDTSAKSIVRQGLESLDRLIQLKLKPPAVEGEEAVMAEPVPELIPPSQAEVAIGLARDLYSEYLPPERRPIVISILAALGVFFLIIVLIKLFTDDEEACC